MCVRRQYDSRTTLPPPRNDGERSTAGFDGKGDALPAEMLPTKIDFNDVTFQLAPAKTGYAQRGSRQRTDDRSSGGQL